jgi:hypothetical protein
MPLSNKAIRLFAGATIAAGLCCCASCGSESSQNMQNIETNVRVSGADPYASCQLVIAAGETNFADTRVEPFVAVDPTSNNMIGVWQQDRWSDGAARGLIAGFSSDSGKTWGQTALPFSACASGGLPEERASDPWVSIGPDGIAYVSSLSYSPNGATPDSAVAVVSSVDGGKTWQNLAVIRRDLLAVGLNDKESVTADPVKPGTAYVVWDQLVAGHGSAAWFSETVDGGVSWSPGKIIYNTVMGEFTGSNQILVDPHTGALYDFFSWQQLNAPFRVVAFVKSTDGGDTWSAPQAVAQQLTLAVTGPNSALIRTAEDDHVEFLARLRERGAKALAASAQIRTGLGSVTVDPTSGQLYAVWEDARFSGMAYNEIAITTSSDGGSIWSNPSRVNESTGGVKFTPTVQVSGNGTVAVSYYDFRNFHGETNTLPTDYWITFSTDAGNSFQNEQHVAGSFNILDAPNGGDGFFLGDYEGLGQLSGAFLPFFVQTNCSDNSCNANSGGPRPTDVFTTTSQP